MIIRKSFTQIKYDRSPYKLKKIQLIEKGRLLINGKVPIGIEEAN